MHRRGTIETAAVTLATLLCVFTASAGPRSDEPSGFREALVRPFAAENVIFIVPDGMGLADVTAARIYLNGPDGAPLNLERLDFVGYQRTHSSSSAITDSAAAASAWACGEKFSNGSICWRADDPDIHDYPESILEIARNRGMATGLVATSTITHATPAAFAAHVHSRRCQNEIARQYLDETEVDVLLGGGYRQFAGLTFVPAELSCPAEQNWIPMAANNGYTIVRTKEEMDAAVAAGARQVLGLFADGPLTREIRRPANSTEPHLAEMTAAALRVLEQDPDGFFLVIEGSQIDWANHARDFDYQLGEMVAFDDAVGEVLDWVGSSARRGERTLVIIVPDHETGGFAINGPYGRLPEKGEKIDPGWTTGRHTAVDTLIWSQGPGAYRLARPVDNTDLFRVMLDALE